MKKRLLLALLVTLLIGAAFFWLVDLNQVIDMLREADWRLLTAGMAALVVGYGMLAFRWHFLLGNRPGFLPAFHATNISNLVNSLTPIPEIALRVLITARQSDMTVPRATSGMLVERSLEQIMRTLAFLAALFTGYIILINSGSILLNAGLTVLTVLAVVWFLWKAENLVAWLNVKLVRIKWLDNQRVAKVLDDFIQGLRLAGGPKRLMVGWMMSFAIWAAFFVFAYLVLLGLNIDLPLEQRTAIALLTLAVATPSAPGMPGLYQATIVGGLSLVAGFNPVLTTAYAILIHILQVIPLIFLGTWGIFATNLTLRGVISGGQTVRVEQEISAGD